jgi:uncharacterized protein (DUF433 family)
MNSGFRRRSSAPPDRVELGRYIVADPEICHGKPTFKGTRIMVFQVLNDVADGRSWDFICNTRWGGRIALEAVAEAVRLAQNALLDKHGRLVDEPLRPRQTLAAA